jgi:hypothetical protein
VGQDSDAHAEDGVSSQVTGHPLVSPNADDSQVMNAVRSEAWRNEIGIRLSCMVDVQIPDVNICADAQVYPSEGAAQYYRSAAQAECAGRHYLYIQTARRATPALRAPHRIAGTTGSTGWAIMRRRQITLNDSEQRLERNQNWFVRSKRRDWTNWRRSTTTCEQRCRPTRYNELTLIQPRLVYHAKRNANYVGN